MARTRTRHPGGGILRWPIAFAVSIMVINDHVLKASCPSAFTGKLSDVAGLLIFPLFLQAVFEVLLSWGQLYRGPDNRLLGGAVLATGLVFSATQLIPEVRVAYSWTMGLLQWPLRWTIEVLCNGGDSTTLRPVRFWSDPSDLWALPALGVSLFIGWARGVEPSESTLRDH